MFLRPEFMDLDNHLIHPDWKLTSDHAPLTVNIHIFEEHIQTRKWTLVKNSEEVLEELIEAIKEINTTNLWSSEVLKSAI